jgi:hypothetical protein
MSEPTEYSEAGIPIFRHTDPDPDPEISGGDGVLIEAISDHVERHIGPLEQVFHEIVSPTVHVDVHWVKPDDARPWHTLVTSGMSERPMHTPPAAEDWAYAELLVCLPPSWPISMEAFADEANYWPVRELKHLARLPHESRTWLSYGHTVDDPDSARPFAGTRFSGVILLHPLQAPEEFFTLCVSPERTIHFWSLVPLYAEEMELKLKEGTNALVERLDRAGVNTIIDPNRPSVVPRQRWWWPFG